MSVRLSLSLSLVLSFLLSDLLSAQDAQPYFTNEVEKVFDVRHVDLTDMPDALNTDHDGRYIKYYRTVPASASAEGQFPAIAVDTSYLYITVDDDTWMRVAIATWSPPAIEGLLEIENSTSIILIEGSATSGISLE